MTERECVPIANFSHICIGVSDVDVALGFYTGLLGMDVVFDVELEGWRASTRVEGSRRAPGARRCSR
jgi:glyoxylase I family protein